MWLWSHSYLRSWAPVNENAHFWYSPYTTYGNSASYASQTERLSVFYHPKLNSVSASVKPIRNAILYYWESLKVSDYFVLCEQKRNNGRLKHFTAEILQLDLFQRRMSAQTECNIPSTSFPNPDVVIMNMGEECFHIGCTKNLLTK